MKEGIMKMKGRRLVSAALVFAVMMLCPLLDAKERQGAYLKITNKDGGRLEGELIAVKPGSLLLQSESAGDVSVELAAIDTIKIVKRSKIGMAALIGGGVGAAFGVIAGIVSPGFTSRGLAALEGAAIFGGGGAAVGGLTGLIISQPKTIKIGGMDESRTKAALEKLRKRARVPDFK
jgi:hypothetical protein